MNDSMNNSRLPPLLRDIFVRLNRSRSTAQCCHRSGLVSSRKLWLILTSQWPKFPDSDHRLANATTTRRTIIPQMAEGGQQQSVRREKSSSAAAIANNPQSRASLRLRHTNADVMTVSFCAINFSDYAKLHSMYSTAPQKKGPRELWLKYNKTYHSIGSSSNSILKLNGSNGTCETS